MSRGPTTVPVQVDTFLKTMEELVQVRFMKGSNSFWLTKFLLCFIVYFKYPFSAI